MLVHKIDTKGYFVVSLDVPDGEPIPKQCVPAQLPVSVTAGKSLRWTGKWIEVDPPMMVGVTKIMVEADDILDRFTGTEQYRIKQYFESTASSPTEENKGKVLSFYNRLLTGKPINVMSPRFKVAVEFLNTRTISGKKLVEDDFNDRILIEWP